MIRRHYDRLILVGVLVALVGSALGLILQIQRGRDDLRDRPWERAPIPHPDVADPDEALLAEVVALAEAPFQFGVTEPRVFTSEVRVRSVDPMAPWPIPFDAMVCPFTQYPQPPVVEVTDTSGDGIPDEWAREHGFNVREVIAHLDPDGDGYTNLEEYQAGTDPNDPASFPPPSFDFRLAQVRSVPFPLVFAGSSRLPSGTLLFTINTGSRTFTRRVGQEVEGWTVVGLDPDDENVLLVERDGDTRRLVRDRQVAGFRVARLISLHEVDANQMPRQVSASEGGTLQVRRNTFQVTSVTDNAVTVVGPPRDRVTEIRRATEAELQELMPPPPPEEEDFAPPEDEWDDPTQRRPGMMMMTE